MIKKFPQSNFGKLSRSSQKKKYKDFYWLEYSVNKDAAFCSPCYLFAKGHKNRDEAFIEIRFRNWKMLKKN